jgi:CO/xanthine dehydrogenase Mo-binding subunit
LAALAADGGVVEALGEITSHERGDALTSFCAQAAQVSVDVETGEVTLLDFVSAHDVAEIISPVTHRGQIEGGIVMGLGFAMCEDLGMMEGRVTAAHLGEYKLPTVADVPPLKVVLVPGAQGVGPQNVKTIGEISNVPSAAAVANAVSNALGVCMDSLPLTPERVLAAIRAQKA